jgi:hypothetical protein
MDRGDLLRDERIAANAFMDLTKRTQDLDKKPLVHAVIEAGADPYGYRNAEAR